MKKRLLAAVAAPLMVLGLTACQPISGGYYDNGGGYYDSYHHYHHTVVHHYVHVVHVYHH